MTDSSSIDKSAEKCPFTGAKGGRRNRDWWPDTLDVSVLHRNSDLSNPLDKAFDYPKEFLCFKFFRFAISFIQLHNTILATVDELIGCFLCEFDTNRLTTKSSLLQVGQPTLIPRGIVLLMRGLSSFVAYRVEYHRAGSETFRGLGGYKNVARGRGRPLS
jgi:hypothetical protein